MQLAISSSRVSTPEQKQNGSLPRQEQNVINMAEKLQVKIIRNWSDDFSSKSGMNLNRKDLKEMLEFCKQNKRVKFLIVDEVDRFMRCIEEFYWYVVEFKKIGVKVVFASQDINDDSLASKVQKVVLVMQAELSNDERKSKVLNGDKAKVKAGLYPFSVKPGYTKTFTKGLHEPDGKKSVLIQQALRNVASGRMNASEALIALNKAGYRTRKSQKPLRIDKFKKILLDDYYAKLISVPKWGEGYQGITGLHKPLITIEEHEAIKAALSGKTKNYSRQQHNPNFQESNAITHECGGKFVGANNGNGKGWSAPKYRCRGCNVSFHKDIVHKGVDKLLGIINVSEKFKSDLSKAMEKVWREEQKSNLNLIANLESHLTELNNQKDDLVKAMVKDEEMAADIRQTISKVKEEITNTEQQITEAKSIDEDLIGFIDFALDFIERKSDKWWEIEWDDREKCKQLMFPEGIYVDFSGKVCTHQISPILNLKQYKRDSRNALESLLVVPRGIEPLLPG